VTPDLDPSKRFDSPCVGGKFGTNPPRFLRLHKRYFWLLAEFVQFRQLPKTPSSAKNVRLKDPWLG
jgi:hypothetical protein